MVEGLEFTSNWCVVHQCCLICNCLTNSLNLEIHFRLYRPDKLPLLRAFFNFSVVQNAV